MDKPREWRIRLYTLIVNDNPSDTFRDQIHVIEKSAYQALEAERDELKRENERLKGIEQDHLSDMLRIQNAERELEQAKDEGAKDLADMRAFQGKFIRSDHELQSLKLLAESYRAILSELQSEIDRGKSKDCLGCCNGNDIPDEELCRACWRSWIGKKMYLLWDWEETEKRIARAALEEEKK